MWAEWIHVPTLVTFFYMVLSPSEFFKKVDTVILKEPSMDEYADYPTAPVLFCKGDSMEEIERDERILKNLIKMMHASNNPQVKLLWEVKMTEFERELRWKRHRYYT